MGLFYVVIFSEGINMTNVLIRKLIGHGYTPEKANNICNDYLRNLSLSDLEELIKVFEEINDVGEVQSESNRKKCRGLFC